MKRIILSGALLGVTAAIISAAPREPNPSARDLLALLPDGATKRQFIIDCTGCHTFHSGIAYPNGRKRTEPEWRDAITRMLGFAGPQSSFPVISKHADPDSTARWLARHLPEAMPRAAAREPAAQVTEFMLPEPRDLPHDLAVLGDGRVLITGMFTDRMYLLDAASGRFETVAIPVERANPRAVELGADGRWWVVLGAPNAIGVYDPRAETWQTHHVGVYAHSVALDTAGHAWFNGHFSAEPEIIGRVDATGGVRTYHVPAHPVNAQAPGPIPYELRTAPDGAIWGSELQGNRVFRFDPRTEQFRVWQMATPHAGPRRLDVDARGLVWIPQYGAGNIAVLDPASGSIREIELPISNTAPYIVRADHERNRVWIATGAGDVVFSYNPAEARFATYHLPASGALVRHMAIDKRTGDVWLAYGASPGIAARVARVSVP